MLVVRRTGRGLLVDLMLPAAALALLASAGLAGAQRPVARARSNGVVRAELAGVLLQSGRYDEAAHEFRTLIDRQGDNAAYRLGLARALAWGGHPREAERELRLLAARQYESATVDTLLRAVRQDFEPRAAEAAGWVAERPDYGPYRLALARALTREGHGALAAAQYDTLIPYAGTPPIPAAPVLVREKAEAYAAAGVPSLGLAVLRDALVLAPGDTALRHGLAALLAQARQLGAAVAQYDTLLTTAPTAALYRERAELHIERREVQLAALDLRTSAALVPAPGTLVLLGDLQRDDGNYTAAADAYRAASAIEPLSTSDRRAIAAGRAQLAREQRPPVALFPVVGEDPGWRVTTEGAGDNLGVRYAATSVRRGQTLGHGFTAALGADGRTLGERAFGATTQSSGFGLDAGIGHEAVFGPLSLRSAVQGGFVEHPGAGATMPEGRAAAALALGPWQGAAELASGPAYPTLMSVESLIFPGSVPLMERDATGTLAGPAGPLDLAFSVQRSTFTDHNTRRTVQAYARLPLSASLALLYAGSGTSFAERSARYWDPIAYTSNALGLELSRRAVRGLSAAVRVLPEYAWSREAVAPAAAATGSDGSPIAAEPWERTEIVSRTAVQFGASGEVSYRAARWELDAALAHGRGRAGAYQRTAATLAVRLLP